MSFENETHINIIQKILANLLDKLRISLILPRIFENPKNALQHLKEPKHLVLMNLVKENIKEKNVTISPQPNYRLIKILDFFQENIQFLDSFTEWLDRLEPLDISMADSFLLLKEATEKRMKKSAMFELNKEKKINEIYQENEKIKRNIKVLQAILKKSSTCYKWKKAVHEVLIQKYEKDLAHCKYENNIRIKQEIIQSSGNIRQIHVCSLTKQEDLEREFDRIRNKYDNLLRENMKKEKSAREERNKLLLQLQSLVYKFDQTMENQIKENMELQHQYERQKELYDSFLIEYYREENEYERVARAKEEEEKHYHEQKILLFMMNRSARVVQKHWRKFRRAQKKAAKRNKSRGAKSKRK